MASPRGAARASRGRGRGQPAKSHQKWTLELDAQLRSAWLAAAPQRDPELIAAGIADALGVRPENVRSLFASADATRDVASVVAAIGTVMGRTAVAITSRLHKLGLDPARAATTLDQKGVTE